jgi:NAD-dependent dihydropyrimidine dehydrogenase PreA subunit
VAVRDIVQIDEELCDGCGDCVTACAEGAIQVIDGKARLVSDIYCDGLGACLGHCPQGAITVIKRESEEFDEEAVIRHLAAVKKAESLLPMTPQASSPAPMPGGCPGSRAATFNTPPPATSTGEGEASRLRHWPIQLHLVPPSAPFFQGSDVLLAADCVAFAVGGFHGRFLHGKSLAIACPKLDSNQEIYLRKLTAMIDQAEIRSLTVMVMEVPCCRGLVQLAQQAAQAARREVPVTCTVVGVQGGILAEHEVA